MGYNQQTPVRAGAKGEVARLVLGMVRVRVGNRQGIVEDGCRLMERHAMFEKILRSLPWIPLELQIALPASFTLDP